MLRRRPLMRAAATTAVVAGTATAVSGHMRRKQDANAQQAAEAQAYRDMQAAPPPPPAAPPPPAGPQGLTPEAIAELQQLAALHEQGILTDEEFATQKARLLA